jgi:endonuclease G
MEECVAQAPYGFPESQKQNTTKVCRVGYALEHDNVAKIPAWVSYTLTPKKATGCFARTDDFDRDRSLPVLFASTPKDYAKSGYDMGHQANDGDMRWDLQAEEDSFILSNMAPQLPGFNRGIWKKLEDYTRGWTISRDNELLIYVGPVYDRAQDPTIGKGFVTVPHAFYKIIVDTETREVQPFLFKHEPSRADLGMFISSIAEIQRQTGLVFPLPKRPKMSKTLWPVKLKSAISSKTCSIQ